MSFSVVVAGTPPCTMAMSKLVPPMSQLMRLGKPAAAPKVSGGDDAGRRPRHDRLHRLLAGDAGSHHAAVALHHQQLGFDRAGLEPAGDALEIAGHDRLDVAVERRGAAALELPHLAQDVGAQRDVDIGPHLTGDRACPPLVVGIEVGVDEVDDQRLGAGRARRLDRLTHLVFVERGHHRAGGVDPLRHLEAALARHDGLEAAEHAPRVGPGAPAELERIAEALGGDEGAAHALALQHGVGADRGAVDDRLEAGRRLAERGEACHEAVGLVRRRRRHLGDAHGCGGGIDQEQVGKGAADIDPEPAAG